uniref:DNA-(apurinic or apyrimidinic site) lyase n=1 Tax=Neospora caninum (strain Liverpool) TaxID=572307 RepID=F0JBB3_NEOCL|nr:hypothetical protein NCLIV_070230 [Neospora caninum Liverpool]CEL71380.1 TPA: hypothetical protein BN1204_070230 [Neospora caninum Liverpool]
MRARRTSPPSQSPSSALSGAESASPVKVEKSETKCKPYVRSKAAQKEAGAVGRRVDAPGSLPRRSPRLQTEDSRKTETELRADANPLSNPETNAPFGSGAVDFDRFRHPEEAGKATSSAPAGGRAVGSAVHTPDRGAPKRPGDAVLAPEEVPCGAVKTCEETASKRNAEALGGSGNAAKVKQECHSPGSFSKDKNVLALWTESTGEDGGTKREGRDSALLPASPRRFLFSNVRGKRRKREEGEREKVHAPSGCAELDIEDIAHKTGSAKTQDPFPDLPDSPEPPHFQEIWDAACGRYPSPCRSRRCMYSGTRPWIRWALRRWATWRCREAAKRRKFSVLVAVMLSSQTKDEQTAACMQRLRDADVLSPEKMNRLSVAELSDLLYGVGFHQNKARFLKEACATLLEKYGGDIPPTYEELVQLKGVGPKMANIAGWGRVEGIAVDVHVHRITNRLNWVKTKNPIETQHALQKFLRRCLCGAK